MINKNLIMMSFKDLLSKLVIIVILMEIKILKNKNSGCILPPKYLLKIKSKLIVLEKKILGKLHHLNK